MKLLVMLLAVVALALCAVAGNAVAGPDPHPSAKGKKVTYVDYYYDAKYGGRLATCFVSKDSRLHICRWKFGPYLSRAWFLVDPRANLWVVWIPKS